MPHILRSGHVQRAGGASPSTLRLQLLGWVDDRPRAYAEAMDAWRSTCPRLSVWDDAVLDGLVRVENEGGGMGRSRVMLTDRGRAIMLDRR